MLDKSVKSGSISSTNVSAQEIARFDALAQSWWDPNGKYKTALSFNATRLGVIESQIRGKFGLSNNEALSDISVVDIGSGGGLISEPLALQGAKVTGIDASSMSVAVAKRHALMTGAEVTYRHMLAEELVAEKTQYDVVINAEVVEHVPDQEALIKQCASLVKPGGMLVLATLNRTWLSYLIAIVGAEYVLRYLPIGTHDWKKFVKPSELQHWVPKNFALRHQTGMSLNPLSGQWKLTSGVPVNYLMCFEHVN